MNKTCALSGHRVLTDLDINLLDRVIENLINNGCRRFLCGMAKGFDLTAAESVLAVKKKCKDVELVACVPFGAQSESLSSADKIRYGRVLAGCSSVLELSESYYKGCMQARNRFMVDNSDILLCYLRRRSGGTYYTVRYAERCGRKVIKL